MDEDIKTCEACSTFLHYADTLELQDGRYCISCVKKRYHSLSESVKKLERENISLKAELAHRDAIRRRGSVPVIEFEEGE